jgi:hypothetical protein
MTEKPVGHVQRHHTKDGIVMRYHARPAHSYLDEIRPRPIIEEYDDNGWTLAGTLIGQVLIVGGVMSAVLCVTLGVATPVPLLFIALGSFIYGVTWLLSGGEK